VTASPETELEDIPSVPSLPSLPEPDYKTNLLSTPLKKENGKISGDHHLSIRTSYEAYFKTYQYVRRHYIYSEKLYGEEMEKVSRDSSIESDKVDNNDDNNNIISLEDQFLLDKYLIRDKTDESEIIKQPPQTPILRSLESPAPMNTLLYVPKLPKIPALNDDNSINIDWETEDNWNSYREEYFLTQRDNNEGFVNDDKEKDQIDDINDLIINRPSAGILNVYKQENMTSHVTPSPAVLEIRVKPSNFEPAEATRIVRQAVAGDRTDAGTLSEVFSLGIGLSEYGEYKKKEKEERSKRSSFCSSSKTPSPPYPIISLQQAVHFIYKILKMKLFQKDTLEEIIETRQQLRRIMETVLQPHSSNNNRRQVIALPKYLAVPPSLVNAAWAKLHIYIWKKRQEQHLITFTKRFTDMGITSQFSTDDVSGIASSDYGSSSSSSSFDKQQYKESKSDSVHRLDPVVMSSINNLTQHVMERSSPNPPVPIRWTLCSHFHWKRRRISQNLGLNLASTREFTYLFFSNSYMKTFWPGSRFDTFPVWYRTQFREAKREINNATFWITSQNTMDVRTIENVREQYKIMLGGTNPEDGGTKPFTSLQRMNQDTTLPAKIRKELTTAPEYKFYRDFLEMIDNIVYHTGEKMYEWSMTQLQWLFTTDPRIRNAEWVGMHRLLNFIATVPLHFHKFPYGEVGVDSDNEKPSKGLLGLDRIYLLEDLYSSLEDTENRTQEEFVKIIDTFDKELDRRDHWYGYHVTFSNI